MKKRVYRYRYRESLLLLSLLKFVRVHESRFIHSKSQVQNEGRWKDEKKMQPFRLEKGENDKRQQTKDKIQKTR
jgi:hypothetical protein